MNPFIPTRSRSQQRMLFVIGLATVYEGLVLVLSLGYLNVNTRAWVLFDVYGDL